MCVSRKVFRTLLQGKFDIIAEFGRIGSEAIIGEECANPFEAVLPLLGRKREVVKVQDAHWRQFAGEAVASAAQPRVVQSCCVLVLHCALDEFIRRLEVFDKWRCHLALKMYTFCDQIKSSKTQPKNGTQNRAICCMNLGTLFLVIF